MPINRYSNITTSQFNPMTLQEMMLVPLSKQKKQDEQYAAQDAIARDLYDMQRLQPDDEAATNIILDYQKQLDNLSMELSKSGVSRDNTQQFKDLYKRYRFDTSNSGDLGRMQNNYKSAIAKEAEFVKTATQQGHSQDYINNRLEAFRKGFSGTINPEGGYNEVGNISGSKFYDIPTEAQTYFKTLPFDRKSIEAAASNIKLNEATGMYEVTGGKNGYIDSNAKQIAEGINAMKQSYENGDRKNFLEYSGIDKKDAWNEIDRYAKSYLFNRENAPEDTTHYMYPPRPAKGTESKATDTAQIYSALGSSRPFFNGAETEAEVKANIAKAEAAGDIAEARRLQKFYTYQKNKYNETPLAKLYERMLNGDSSTKTTGLKTMLAKENNISFNDTKGSNNQSNITTNNLSSEELLNPQNRVTTWTMWKGSDGTWNAKVPNTDIPAGKETKEMIRMITPEGKTAYISKDLYNRTKEVQNVYTKYQEGLDKTLQTFQKNNVEFQMTDLKTADNTVLNRDLTNVIRNAKSNEFTITDGIVLDNATDDSENLFGSDKSGWFTGNWLTGDNDTEDQKTITNMLANPNTKIEFLSYISQNHTGLPAIKIQVTPDSENENFGGKSLQLTLDLNNLNTKGTSVSAVDQLILDKFGKLGGAEGKALQVKGKQRIKYQDIEPSFILDFSSNDAIQQHNTNPITKSILGGNKLDIGMVGDNYFFQVKDRNGSHAVGWGDLLKNIPAKDTVKRLKSLSPRLMDKLVEDVKNILGITNFDETSEEQVDNALNELGDNNMSINMSDYYDLLDLISKE